MPINFSIPVIATPGRQDKVHALAPASEGANVATGRAEKTGGERQESSVAVQSLPRESHVDDRKQLQQAVQEINSVVQNLQRDLQFRVDTESGMTVISVIDSQTKEVIRQLPAEDVLERARRMDEAAKGEFPVDGLLLKMKI